MRDQYEINSHQLPLGFIPIIFLWVFLFVGCLFVFCGGFCGFFVFFFLFLFLTPIDLTRYVDYIIQYINIKYYSCKLIRDKLKCRQ